MNNKSQTLIVITNPNKIDEIIDYFNHFDVFLAIFVLFNEMFFSSSFLSFERFEHQLLLSIHIVSI